jgi:hypothetical protein
LQNFVIGHQDLVDWSVNCGTSCVDDSMEASSPTKCIVGNGTRVWILIRNGAGETGNASHRFRLLRDMKAHEVAETRLQHVSSSWAREMLTVVLGAEKEGRK